MIAKHPYSVVCPISTRIFTIGSVIAIIVWVIMVMRLRTIIMIIVPTNIPLGIRWNESIILVVRKWVLVVLILMWIYAVVLGWERQRKVVWLMIVWMVHWVHLGVMTISASVVCISMRNCFVLCNIEP